MTKTVKAALIVLVLAFIMAALNMRNIYAMFWKVEGATVVLQPCSEDCELTGTLGVVPFDGRYYIENQDGRFYLEPGSYTMIRFK
ncbi:MAG: hypothetical protein LAT63_16565 [Marinobacter sp.]|nr:hypothetical protein [Marinobacter sp.]